MEKMNFSSYEIANSIKETVADGGSFPLVVTGTSMQPFLKDGKDIVWLGKCNPSDIKKRTIILFERSDDSLGLHRIKQVNCDGTVVVNGDGQTRCETIRREKVIAVVTHIEKNGKKTPCDKFSYSVKVSLWQSALPIRYYILKIWKLFR